MQSTILGGYRPQVIAASAPAEANGAAAGAAAVEAQASAGLDLPSACAATWPALVADFAAGLNGLAADQSTREGGAPRLRLTGSPDWVAPIGVAAWQHAAATSAVAPKAVVPGPWSLATAIEGDGQPVSDAALVALAEAVGAEARALAAAGAPLIELDEPALARAPDWPHARAALERTARVAEASLALAVWGGDVAELDGLFALPFAAFNLDFVAGPRNWPLLDRFPASATLGLGLLDARSAALEHPPSIGNAVWGATLRHSPRRLQVHPSAPLDALTAEQAAAKLALLVQVVREARASVE